MKLLPFEKITYKTKLNSEEILNRINEILEPRKTNKMIGIFGSNDHNDYKGSINGNSFTITRIISYRNSFLPIIDGVIEKDLIGTKITVKMRLHSLVIIFMRIWFGGVGLGCLAVLATLFKVGIQSFHPMSLTPFGMLIFGYALVTYGFKYESAKSKEYLFQLFEDKK